MPQIKAQMDGMGDDDWLFRATRGGNVWTNTWRTRIWNKAVKAAGMEDAGVTIHSLRHTYASFAIAQGADVKTLQMQLGHSSPSITLNTYTALWPERLKDVADAIGALREARTRVNRAWRSRGVCMHLYADCFRRKKISPENLMFPRAPVGLTGFEPATSCSQSRRATKLRYSPFMHSRTWQVNTSFHCSVW